LSLPSVVPGILRDILRTISFLALTAAGVAFYLPQIPSANYNTLHRHATHAGVALSLAAVGLSFRLPGVAILSLLVLAFLWSMTYYELQITDPEGIMFLIAVVNSVSFAALGAALNWAGPGLLLSAQGFIVLTLWSAVASFAVTFGALYFAPKNRAPFFMNAAFLGWMHNVVGLFIYVLSRPDAMLIYHLFVLRGTVMLVLVALPLVALVLTQVAAVLALDLYHADSKK